MPSGPYYCTRRWTLSIGQNQYPSSRKAGQRHSGIGDKLYRYLNSSTSQTRIDILCRTKIRNIDKVNKRSLVEVHHTNHTAPDHPQCTTQSTRHHTIHTAPHHPHWTTPSILHHTIHTAPDCTTPSTLHHTIYTAPHHPHCTTLHHTNHTTPQHSHHTIHNVLHNPHCLTPSTLHHTIHIAPHCKPPSTLNFVYLPPKSLIIL